MADANYVKQFPQLPTISKPQFAEELLLSIEERVSSNSKNLEDTHSYLLRDLDSLIRSLVACNFKVQLTGCRQCWFTQLFAVCITLNTQYYSLKVLKGFSVFEDASSCFFCTCINSQSHVSTFVKFIHSVKEKLSGAVNPRLLVRAVCLHKKDEESLTAFLRLCNHLSSLELLELASDLEKAVKEPESKEAGDSCMFALKRVGFNFRHFNGYTGQDFIKLLKIYNLDRALLKYFNEVICLECINTEDSCLLFEILTTEKLHQDLDPLKQLSASPFFEEALSSCVKKALDGKKFVSFFSSLSLMLDFDEEVAKAVLKGVATCLSCLSPQTLISLLNQLFTEKFEHFVQSKASLRRLTARIIKKVTYNKIETLSQLKDFEKMFQAIAWFGNIEFLKIIIKKFTFLDGNTEFLNCTLYTLTTEVTFNGHQLKPSSCPQFKREVFNCLISEWLRALRMPNDSESCVSCFQTLLEAERYLKNSAGASIICEWQIFIDKLSLPVTAKMFNSIIKSELESKEPSIKESFCCWEILNEMSNKILAKKSITDLANLTIEDLNALMHSYLFIGSATQISDFCSFYCKIPFSTKRFEELHSIFIRDPLALELVMKFPRGILAFTYVVDARVRLVTRWLARCRPSGDFVNVWEREIDELLEMRGKALEGVLGKGGLLSD